MSRQQYETFRFTDESLRLISVVNRIVAAYSAQGFRLTVRQIYYQLVANDEFRIKYSWDATEKKWVRDPNGTINAEPNYKALGNLVKDGRLAGLIDWDAIEDRTRTFVRRQRWESGKHILQAAADSYHMDMWRDQRSRVFVIVEKEALIGVLGPTCNKFDVPILAARGYASVSVLREFVVEDILPTDEAQNIVIIYLGDHDPSGVDMTRDIGRRVELFCEGRPFELSRIALTMDQVQGLNASPNRAKNTDARYKAYVEEFGQDCWELDALSPGYLAKLVADEIDKHRDADLWETQVEEVEAIRARLTTITRRFRQRD